MAFLTLFLLGFFGGAHCVGMCGALNGAVMLQRPPHIGRVRLLLLLNAGRLCSYAAAGVLVGALSQTGVMLDHTHRLQLALWWAANILLLLTGLYLAGLWAAAAKIERIGKPVWRRLNPLLGRLLPLRSARACFAAGLLWGWLPCGLVYNAALYALGSGSAVRGGLYLLVFGLGTLPNVLAVGLAAAQLQAVLRHRGVRLAAGLTVSAWAAWQMAAAFFQAA